MEKLEFKGTKEQWKSVYIPKTKYHSDRYEVQYGKDGECIAEFVHNEFDSKLISSAPDLLEALQEMVKQNELRGYGDSEDSIKAKQAIEKALK